MITFTKKLFSDPKFYADLALCAVMILVIAAAAGKSLPQLGRGAWAAVANITGDGTQSALAQFTGTNTIGDATLTLSSIVTDLAGGGSTSQGIGTHFACFLASVYHDESHGHGEQCLVFGSAGGSWTLSAYVKDEGQTQCQALCIN